jgi:hypothetical protein
MARPFLLVTRMNAKGKQKTAKATDLEYKAAALAEEAVKGQTMSEVVTECRKLYGIELPLGKPRRFITEYLKLVQLEKEMEAQPEEIKITWVDPPEFAKEK